MGDNRYRSLLPIMIDKARLHTLRGPKDMFKVQQVFKYHFLTECKRSKPLEPSDIKTVQSVVEAITWMYLFGGSVPQTPLLPLRVLGLEPEDLQYRSQLRYMKSMAKIWTYSGEQTSESFKFKFWTGLCDAIITQPNAPGAWLHYKAEVFVCQHFWHRELTTVFSDLRNVPPEPLYHSQLNWMAAMALQMDIAMELFQDTYSHCVNRAIEDYPNSTIDTVQYCAEKWTWTTITGREFRVRPPPYISEVPRMLHMLGNDPVYGQQKYHLVQNFKRFFQYYQISSAGQGRIQYMSELQCWNHYWSEHGEFPGLPPVEGAGIRRSRNCESCGIEGHVWVDCPELRPPLPNNNLGSQGIKAERSSSELIDPKIEDDEN